MAKMPAITLPMQALTKALSTSPRSISVYQYALQTQLDNVKRSCSITIKALDVICSVRLLNRYLLEEAAITTSIS